MRTNNRRDQAFVDKIKTVTFGTGAKPPPVSTPKPKPLKTEVLKCCECGASFEAKVYGEKKCDDGGTIKWGLARMLTEPHSDN
jgi:hypothetical protein